MIPYQMRIQKELLDDVKKSSKVHSEGNANREARELIRLGLKARKKQEKQLEI